MAEGPRRLSSPSRGPARPSFQLTAPPPSSPDKAGNRRWVGGAEAELLASSHVSPESSQRWIKRLDKPPGWPLLLLLLFGAEPLFPARARTESALATPPPLAAPLAPHRALPAGPAFPSPNPCQASTGRSAGPSGSTLATYWPFSAPPQASLIATFSSFAAENAPFFSFFCRACDWLAAPACLGTALLSMALSWRP